MSASASDLRARIAGGATLAWSELPDALVVGVLARSGADAVLLDQQHGAHDTRSCIDAMAEARLADCPVLVRIKVGDMAEAAKMLDFGAVGVVAPMIDGPEQAAALVQQVKFPPIGQRSYGPMRAATLAGEGPQEYLARANHDTLAIAMIETVAAVDALDDILAVPGLDGVLAGPADLSLSMGRFDPEGAAVSATLARIATRTRAAGKIAIAFAGSPGRARILRGMGYQLVAAGSDASLLRMAAGAAVLAAKD
jgi:4-hydroxy-2-oxoheptanedioate aldolase